MKLSRQEAIKQIIKTQVIETQSDLAEALKKAGFCDAGHCVQGYQGYGLD